MAELSKTAKAAMTAAQRGQAKEVKEHTPQEIIHGIRNHLDAKLAVTPNDVRVLLAEYDKLSDKDLGQ